MCKAFLSQSGAVATKEVLKKWVDYAIEHKSIILYDAAYESFITDESIPHSIYEIEGAKQVALEFRSFSKTAGFTGTRCAFTVIPGELMAYDKAGNPHQVKKLWNRRHSTKFNGVSYPVQKAAAAIFTEEGKKEVAEVIAHYPNKVPAMLRITREAKQKSQHQKGQNNSFPEDAYRHIYWSYHLTRALGPELAKEITDAHETAPGNSKRERQMDYHNNEVGRSYANENLSNEDIKNRALNAGEIIRNPNQIR